MIKKRLFGMLLCLAIISGGKPCMIASDSNVAAMESTDTYKNGYSLLMVEDDEKLLYSGICGDNLIWTIDDKGVLTISGVGAMYDWDMTEIEPIVCTNTPWDMYRSIITDVIIENGVNYIGNYAFVDCENLSNISIPDTVVEIGSNTFSMCFSLEEVIIPDSVTDIGVSLFCDCINLRSVKLSSNISNIGSCMFMNCYRLERFDAPTNLHTIGDGAFLECNGLQHVNLSEGTMNISMQCHLVSIERKKVLTASTNIFVRIRKIIQII